MLQRLSGPASKSTGLAFTPDCNPLVSANYDQTIRVWDVETGQCLHVLHPEGPYAGLNITGVTAITGAQMAAPMALEAVEQYRSIGIVNWRKQCYTCRQRLAAQSWATVRPCNNSGSGQ